MFELILLVISVVTNFAVGLSVFSRDPRQPLNRAYGVLALSFVVLAAANYFTLTPNPFALLCIRIVIVATTIMSLTLFYLVLILRRGEWSAVSRYQKLLIIPTILLVLLELTPLVFSGLDPNASKPSPIAAPGAALFLLHFVCLIAASLYVVVRGAASSIGVPRSQYQYILLGIMPILIFAPITGFVLPVLYKQTEFIAVTPLYTTIFVLMIAYAIVRHKLFDIRLAAVRTAAYALSLGSLAAFYYLLAYVVSITLFQGQTETTVSSPVNIGLALVLAFLFQPIKQFFDRVTNKFFYRENYKTEDFFAQLSDLLSSTVDLRGLLTRASEQIASTLKAEQAFFFLYYTNAIDHHMSAGMQGHIRLPIADARLLDEYAEITTDNIIVTNLLNEKHRKLQRMLQSYRIALVMPLRRADKISGYVMLGERLSGDYTKRDLNVLSTIGNELVIAIQNALSLHEVKELNATLQQRIDVATKELRSSNSQLKHLDEVKDEFMSMASHQLRTPLTSIKGYISMVLEGDAGKVSPQQKRLLVEAYKSSERMVGLIADFLNVSRLQTGKFIIEKTSFDLNEVVRQEVADLELISTSHDIKLRLERTKHLLPVRADESKVRQVIMNFIDNAIYYSHPKSTILIKLEKVKDTAVLTVIDSGIGVPKDEQVHLFNKFFRAKNARKQRPDGTGVGLYLARRVITAHSGSIIFSSKEGKGSTFGFRLPLHAAPEQKKVEQKSSEPTATK
jgi:signal transduction histidine kinase